MHLVFRPQVREILTDVIQILVPRLFVPLNLKVTLVSLYQGSQAPGEASLWCPCGVTAVSLRSPCGGMSCGATPGGRLFLLAAAFFRFVIPARFLIVSTCVFERNWAPKWTQNGAKMIPKWRPERFLFVVA